MNQKRNKKILARQKSMSKNKNNEKLFYILRRMGWENCCLLWFSFSFCSRLLKNCKKQKKEFLIFFFVASMLKYLNVYNFYSYIHKIQFNKVSHYWFYRKLLASISLPYRLYHNVECFIRYIQGMFVRMYICMYIYINVYIHIFSFILVLNIMLWKSMSRNRNESVEENEDEIDGKW